MWRGFRYNQNLEEGKVMLLITLDAVCFVLFSVNALLNASQKKWGLTVIWSTGALCWLVSGVLNYTTYIMGH